MTARTCAARRYRGRVRVGDDQCHNHAGYFCAGDAGRPVAALLQLDLIGRSLLPHLKPHASGDRSPHSCPPALLPSALLPSRSPTLVFGLRVRCEIPLSLLARLHSIPSPTTISYLRSALFVSSRCSPRPRAQPLTARPWRAAHRSTTPVPNATARRLAASQSSHAALFV